LLIVSLIDLTHSSCAEIASDRKTLARFSNELKIARKIVHKNVGRMYELMEDEGVFFITMEYVPGQDLKGLIRQSRQLTSGTAISITKQICEGLSEAHGLGVVHRDLKPSNIMIDKQGNARIMDFGIARSLKAKGITRVGAMIGTPEYMSPEQVEGKEVDQRSDLYSLGVILYEMVTGRVPFEGETPLSIARKHADKTPPDPKAINPQISDDLSNLILKCLEKDKENRYQNAGELRSELENIEKGIPTTDREIPKRKPITSKEITVSFSLKKLLIPALIVITFVIIAIVIWQLIPQREALLVPKIENSIAVISFENLTGDRNYDIYQKVIPNLLIAKFEQTGYFYVTTWERMRDILKQVGKGEVEDIDRDLGFEACRSEGIEAVVLGSFTKAEDTFAVDVKVLDVETKKLLKTADSKGEGIDSIINTQIDDLAREISQGLGISRQKIEAADLKVQDVTTTSVDAYNYFLRGREEYEKGHRIEAIKFLEKAVELDPEFALAYLELGNAKDPYDREGRNEAYERAKNLSQKANEKERLYIEAYYAVIIEGDREKQFQILKKLEEKYPREKRVHFELGSYFLLQRMFDEAIREFNRTLDLDPEYGPALDYLGYTYSDMGKYEKAVEYFRSYASASPGDVDPLNSLAYAYMWMGRLDEAMAKFKEALEIKPDYRSSRQGLIYVYALKEDYSEAIKRIEEFIASESSSQAHHFIMCRAFFHSWLGRFDRAIADSDIAAETRINALQVKGWVCYYLGELDLGRKLFKKVADYWVETYPVYEAYNLVGYYFDLGLCDLKEGRIDSARRRLSEIQSLILRLDQLEMDEQSIMLDTLLGEILIAEGAFEEAVSVFKRILPLKNQGGSHLILMNWPFLKDGLARAYLKKGELEKAIAEYEELTTFNPGSHDLYLIHPLYYYRLGKLYEEKGQERKAIEQYEKFLDLWKDADPGIAEVEDARKRLAGLKNQ